jgi:hypothetical protein
MPFGTPALPLSSPLLLQAQPEAGEGALLRERLYSAAGNSLKITSFTSGN